MKMSRPYSFPDPNDRSKNDPCTIVSSKKVLGIYNQENGDNQMQKVTSKVQEWFRNKALENGWSDTRFSGGQCILEYKFDE